MRFRTIVSGVALGLVLVPNVAFAESRRALLVGIDRYKNGGGIAAGQSARGTKICRPEVSDLDGCVNDVEAVKAVLIARWGFKESDILILRNEEATRSRILKEIKQQLGDKAVPGDIGVFYFSGHGSTVKNALSIKEGGMDVTLVPADTASGAADIRDKELGRALNEVLDRGVLLTAFFDSCHSGGATRGPTGKVRVATESTCAVEDPGFERTKEQKERLLSVSAVLPSQAEYEVTFEDRQHGALTAAFLKVARTAPIELSAEKMFRQIKAVMQDFPNAGALEPDIEGEETRLKRPLLGVGDSRSNGRVTVEVKKALADGRFELQGGSAIGLAPGCELQTMIDQKNSGAVRLRVDEIAGLNRAIASVIEGQASALNVGRPLEVVAWAPLAANLELRVWVPAEGLPIAVIDEAAREAKSIASLPGISWVDDETKEPPSALVSFEKGRWRITEATAIGRTVDLGSSLKAADVFAWLRTHPQPNPWKLFIQLPPASEFLSTTKFAQDNVDRPYRVVSEKDRADYLLAGRVAFKPDTAPVVQYSLVRPTASAAAEKTSGFPLRTDWQPLGASPNAWKTLAGTLDGYGYTLQRIKGWQTVSGVPENSPRRFPYSLSFTLLKASGAPPDADRTEKMFGGEEYALELVRDREYDENRFQPRFVYVFSIDRDGRSQLIYPIRGDDNRLPIRAADAPLAPETIKLFAGRKAFTVGAPYGLDTYMMVTSPDRIEEDIFSFDPVRTRGDKKGWPNVGLPNRITQFLFDVGRGTRGQKLNPQPIEFAVERHRILSEASRER